MALSLQPIIHRDPFSDCESFTVESVSSQLKAMVNRAERKRLDKIASKHSFDVYIGTNHFDGYNREIQVTWADIEAFAAQENMHVSRALAAIKRSDYWREVFRDFMGYQVGWN